MSSDLHRAPGSSGPGPGGLGPGTLLDGKYEILMRIGAGGMGEVFKARHLHLNAFRCIKVMKQELLADEVFRSRFLREARLATQIHHSNIAVVHDFFVSESGNYMVTEFIEGRTVRQWSAANGPFPLPLAADFASQVLTGLAHIHRRGLLHRDISPDNVMLAFDADDRCVVKIIDLGIAKDMSGTAAADTTQAGVLIGNPKYMSPEQLGLIADGEQLDGRADLYCLGVVLYEMLLGVAPFMSETPHGYIMKHLTQPPRRFKEAKPQLTFPDAIEAVILRALEKDRGRRYASAADFAAALAPFLQCAVGTLTREDVEPVQPSPDNTVVLDVSKLTTDDALAESAFQGAWEDGQTGVWRDYLSRFPNSARVAEAQKLLTEAEAFEAAAATQSETAVRQFLVTWPDARHHLEASILLARIKEKNADRRDIEEARARNTPQAWRAYLAAHARALYSEEAREALLGLETAAFTSLLHSQDARAAQMFETNFPDSARIVEVRALVARWAAAERAQAEEPADWDRAWESGTAAAWDQYLSAHASSPRIAEARERRQEAADFEVAQRTNTAAMWRAFMKAWPEGRHRFDVEILLQRAR